jgi:hypothetical protein
MKHIKCFSPTKKNKKKIKKSDPSSSSTYLWTLKIQIPQSKPWKPRTAISGNLRRKFHVTIRNKHHPHTHTHTKTKNLSREKENSRWMHVQVGSWALVFVSWYGMPTENICMCPPILWKKIWQGVSVFFVVALAIWHDNLLACLSLLHTSTSQPPSTSTPFIAYIKRSCSPFLSTKRRVFLTQTLPLLAW